MPYGDRVSDPASVDCWQLVRLVYRAALGVELPAWDTVPSADPAAVAAAAGAERLGWLPVPPGSERPLDVALILRGRHACHVGLIVERGRLLHVQPGETSCVDRYDPHRGGRPFRFAGIHRLAR